MNIERLTTPWWFPARRRRRRCVLLANWPAYLSPIAAQILPLSPSSFMHVIGGVEMLVGFVILAGYTRLGGYVAAIWLVGIAANLVTTGHHFDVAVRDVIMAIAAFTLARLTEARASEEAGEGIGGLSLLSREKMIA
jgi:hypothetical protein